MGEKNAGLTIPAGNYSIIQSEMLLHVALDPIQHVRLVDAIGKVGAAAEGIQGTIQIYQHR